GLARQGPRGAGAADQRAAPARRGAVKATSEGPVMTRLNRLELKGWKTIRDLPGLDFRAVNVFIGANGAGKSNLFSFFRMLRALAQGELQLHVSREGGANALLHDGAKTTPELSAVVDITTPEWDVAYDIRLAHAATDILVFARERWTAAWRASDAGS